MWGNRHNMGYQGSVYLETLPLNVQLTRELGRGPSNGSGSPERCGSLPRGEWGTAPVSLRGCREGSVRFCPHGTQTEEAP